MPAGGVGDVVMRVAANRSGARDVVLVDGDGVGGSSWAVICADGERAVVTVSGSVVRIRRRPAIAATLLVLLYFFALCCCLLQINAISAHCC